MQCTVCIVHVMYQPPHQNDGGGVCRHRYICRYINQLTHRYLYSGMTLSSTRPHLSTESPVSSFPHRHWCGGKGGGAGRALQRGLGRARSKPASAFELKVHRGSTKPRALRRSRRRPSTKQSGCRGEGCGRHAPVIARSAVNRVQPAGHRVLIGAISRWS